MVKKKNNLFLKIRQKVSIKYYFYLNHSHKKGKDSLEGSLDRVLYAPELVSGYLFLIT